MAATTPAESPRHRRARFIHGLVALLTATAVLYFAWPVYRAWFKIEIDTNEGWNAYFDDAALGSMPLYPAPSQLITNNYPPLSFLIVGALGRVIGDTILAGRLLSLAAVAALAGAIALCVRRLGGDRLGAIVGASLFVGMMSRSFLRYVGMDDPQLLAQAVMAFGFAAFLAARQRDRGFVWPILLMVAAGFIKHNIIAMPSVAVCWLLLYRRSEGVKCVAAAAVAITLGFAACYVAYGPNFVSNMLTPRVSSMARAWHGIGHLKCLDVALIVYAFIAYIKRRDPSVQLCSFWILLSLGVYFLQKMGSGVDVNAAFDLIIASSVGAGLACTHAASIRAQRLLHRGLGPSIWQTVLLLALCWRMVPFKRLESLPATRLLFDKTLRYEIGIREQAMADSVALVKATRGNVMCSNFVCYRAGKPYAVDRFNVSQRMARGTLPRTTYSDLIKRGELTKVETDPRADWDEPAYQ